MVVSNTVEANGYDWKSYTEAATGTGATNTAATFGDAASPGGWNGSSGVLNALRINATAVPEPSCLSLVTLAGLGLLRRRR